MAVRDRLHRGLKALHHSLPESWKRGVRPWYLRSLYWRLFPEMREHDPRTEAGRGWAELVPAPSTAGAPTLICMPVTPWQLRFQRPQQLCARLAARGWRVLYLDPELDGVPYREDGPWLARWTSPLGPGTLLAKLPVAVRADIHHELASVQDVERMLSGLISILDALGASEIVACVQLPFWTTLAIRVRDVLGAGLVYDCLDEHSGFAGADNPPLELEPQLMREADVVVVTSEALERKARPFARRVARVPNGCDVEHFHRATALLELADLPRPIFGYMGVLAGWFDPSLVAALARAHPQATVLLVGHTFPEVKWALRDLPNVHFVGEVENALVASYVAAFDVALIPFRINALTRATHPVKLFEYFAAGKPVASVRLPELEPYEGLVCFGDTPAEFAAAAARALAASDGDPAARLAVAHENDWERRAVEFDRAIRDSGPSASIIVISHNHWPYTHACLDHLMGYLPVGRCEVVVVDNASTDGTRQGLYAWSLLHPSLRVIWNSANRGFAAACNQGLGAARGDRLVLLNNDTLVTPGWLRGLVRQLQDPRVGMAGPVTNSAGNEAQLPVNYRDHAGMLSFARDRQVRFHGRSRDVPMLGMFCVALRRDTWEKVGPLDEGFEIGLFEDDDYSQRVGSLGLRLVCAEDVFVHHFGSVSFGSLSDRRRREIFERNRRRFEGKWGRPWQAHSLRSDSRSQAAHRE